MRIALSILFVVGFFCPSYSQNSCENSTVLNIENQTLPLEFEVLEDFDYSGNIVTASTLKWFQVNSVEDINAEFVSMEGIAFNVFSGSCSNLVRYIGGESTLRLHLTAGTSYLISIGKTPYSSLTPNSLSALVFFSNSTEDVIGCADPMALNFEYNSFHNGVCTYYENFEWTDTCLIENQAECPEELYCIQIQNPLINSIQNSDFVPEGYLTRVYPDVYYYPSLPAAHNFCLTPGCYIFESNSPPLIPETPYVVPYIIQGEGINDITGYVGTTIHFSVGSNYCMGCMDPNACNYSFWADEPLDNCTYSSVEGTAFHDQNNNSVNDGVFNFEYGASNQNFIVHPIELEILSDEDGRFFIPELPEGTYTLEWTGNEEMWTTSTPSEVDFTYPLCHEINFGIVPGLTFESASFSYSSLEPHISCIYGFHPYFTVSNTGNSPLHGSIQLTLDPTLQAATTFGVEPPISILPGEILWDIEQLIGASQNNYSCHILGPGGDTAGDEYEFEYHIILYNENNDLVVDEILNVSESVACSYDPNIKVAQPIGYEEPHFILPETFLNYTIHFQNTGNAMAYNIQVIDSLDVSSFDLSSFEVLGGSHPFSTTTSPDGVVHFYFNDILLLDSTTNEALSHGFANFRIKAHEDLVGWDEIRNDAYIYFDSNSPILTPEVVRTIFDCGWLTGLPEYDNSCLGEYATLDLTQIYVDDYTWTMNGETVGDNAGQIVIDLPEAIEYTLGLQISNPLCTLETSMPVIVHEYPDSTILIENTSLTAATGLYYQWYQNDIAIPNATEQTYTPGPEIELFDGGFWCSIVSEFGCITSSEWVFFVGANENDILQVSLYPNPTDGLTTLSLPNGTWEVSIFNPTGQKITTHSAVKDQIEIDTSVYRSGLYTMTIKNVNESSYIIKLVVR